MADIQYWKDAIVSELEVIRNLVQTARNTSDDTEKVQSLETADRKLRATKSNTRSFKMEIRLIFDHNERSRYDRELTSYEQSIAQLTAEVKTIRSGGERSALFLGAKNDLSPNGNGIEYTEEDAVRAGDAMLQDAERLQDKTGQALNNTEQMIGEAKMVGASTVEELQRQREQIQEIESNVMKVDDHLNRADRLIKTFGKRMATDKLIQCFACFNIMLISAIVVYTVVKRGMKDDENDNDRRPESPVDSRMLRGFLPNMP